MSILITFHRYKPTRPKKLYLTTPLYIATLAFGLAGTILLIFCGDGFDTLPNDHGRYSDDIMLFPITALFISAMTPSIRCFLWLQSWWVQIRWVRPGAAAFNDEGRIQVDEDEILDAELGERWGVIRLPEYDDGEDKMTSMRRFGWLTHVLLSWNAWLAATLAASLGVLLWRLSENFRGRALNLQAGLGALFLAVDW